MKRLQNTLYIISENYYLSLDGSNVVVNDEHTEVGRVPLHNLEAIVVFTYRGASPALLGACAEQNIDVVFLSPHGRFLAKITGRTKGNVVLRRSQYRIADEQQHCLPIAKNCIIGKLYNCRWVLERAKRDHTLQVDVERLSQVCHMLQESIKFVQTCETIDEIRGYEGAAAAAYFSVFNELILQQKDQFVFQGRNRRPPLDRVNALLSLSYTLLTSMTVSALESVGLDPAVGFMHGERPGRSSLALDMVEELRPVLADRFVLTLINKKMVTAKDFDVKESGAVILTDDARKRVLSEWQSRKQDEITHPYLSEKIQWGMVPYAQAMLLARMIRGDLDAYPPFFWK